MAFSRIDALLGFIRQKPSDPFPRYALALEYKNAGRLEEAHATFSDLLAQDAGYTAAYLHAGRTLMALGRSAEAKALWARGAEVCFEKGDSHARAELQAELASAG